jgi:hypothetical protein
MEKNIFQDMEKDIIFSNEVWLREEYDGNGQKLKMN